MFAETSSFDDAKLDCQAHGGRLIEDRHHRHRRAKLFQPPSNSILHLSIVSFTSLSGPLPPSIRYEYGS